MVYHRTELEAEEDLRKMPLAGEEAEAHRRLEPAAGEEPMRQVAQEAEVEVLLAQQHLAAAAERPGWNDLVEVGAGGLLARLNRAQVEGTSVLSEVAEEPQQDLMAPVQAEEPVPGAEKQGHGREEVVVQLARLR